MRLISHRGNLVSPAPHKENSIPHLQNALDEGFDVELDLWRQDGEFFIGHDRPQYPVEHEWLNEKPHRLWIHCKNLNCLQFMTQTDWRYFWHQSDEFTLTSTKHIWTFPQKQVTPQSILVCTNFNSTQAAMEYDMYGLCSDYVGYFK